MPISEDRLKWGSSRIHDEMYDVFSRLTRLSCSYRLVERYAMPDSISAPLCEKRFRELNKGNELKGQVFAMIGGGLKDKELDSLCVLYIQVYKKEDPVLPISKKLAKHLAPLRDMQEKIVDELVETK